MTATQLNDWVDENYKMLVEQDDAKGVIQRLINDGILKLDPAKKTEPCGACYGSGEHPSKGDGIHDYCNKCEGTGRVESD